MARLSHQKNRFKKTPGRPSLRGQVHRHQQAEIGRSGSHTYVDSGGISIHPVLSDSTPYAVTCQCPICLCNRPVGAQPDGLAVCGECKRKHYPTDRD